MKQTPQLPANKNNTTDSTGIILQIANEKLTEAEDSLLQEFVNKQDSTYSKSADGYWYRITKHKKTTKSEQTKVRYSVYTLQNELLFSEEKTIIAGKKELIPALDNFLLNHPEASEASLIIPWHQAFGVKGKSPEVNAYQSVKVSIIISKF